MFSEHFRNINNILNLPCPNPKNVINHPAVNSILAYITSILSGVNQIEKLHLLFVRKLTEITNSLLNHKTENNNWAFCNYIVIQGDNWHILITRHLFNLLKNQCL